MSTDPGVLLALAAQIQATCLDPGRWPFVFETIRSIFGGIAVQMSGFDLLTGKAYSGINIGYDPDFIASFDRYYGRINPFVFRNPPIGRTFALDRIVSHDEIARTEFWADWMRPQEDLSAGGGLLLPTGPGRIVSFGGGIRRRDQERLEGPFLDLIETIRPLVATAVAINEAMANLRFDACMLRRGVETTDTAVLVIDKDRRPVSLNAQAEHLIAERRTLGLAASGAIAFPDARVNGWLTGCIAGRTRLGAMRFGDGDGDRATCRLVRVEGEVAELVAFPGNIFVVPPVFVLVITHDHTPGDPVALIARKAGLTRSEAEIALAIAEGASPSEIAGQRGRHLSTIRNQLKAIFDKTGSRRQADLVRLVERLRRGG